MENTFHWAILGLGKIARKFADDLKTIEDAELVAVGSRSQERASAFAATYGVEYATGSYASLFNGPRIDAVYIATPHASHYELVNLCIEQGVAVLCEKPLGLSDQEVEKMVALARNKGVFLMEALWSRFTPTTAKVLELIEAGTLGEIEGLRADFGFRANPATAKRLFDPALGGGSLLDIGIYPIWLNQIILGEPEEITVAARLDENGIDREIHVSLRNKEGKLGHAFSTFYGRTRTEALIIGTKADLHWHTRFHEPSNFSILREGQSPENFFFEQSSNGYAHEARAVMQDVRAARTENEHWSLEDSLILHRTLTKIRAKAGIHYP